MSQEVSVDESLLLWKGHHPLQPYIPSKADKWGFKFYALAESSTGYISNLLVDQGRNTLLLPKNEFPALQKPGRYVMTLMKPILNRGHILGVDNFYTDVTLFKHLLNNGTDCVGTVRKGRRHIPPEVMQIVSHFNLEMEEV